MQLRWGYRLGAVAALGVGLANVRPVAIDATLIALAGVIATVDLVRALWPYRPPPSLDEQFPMHTLTVPRAAPIMESEDAPIERLVNRNPRPLGDEPGEAVASSPSPTPISDVHPAGRYGVNL